MILLVFILTSLNIKWLKYGFLQLSLCLWSVHMYAYMCRIQVGTPSLMQKIHHCPSITCYFMVWKGPVNQSIKMPFMLKHYKLDCQMMLTSWTIIVFIFPKLAPNYQPSKKKKNPLGSLHTKSHTINFSQQSQSKDVMQHQHDANYKE